MPVTRGTRATRSSSRKTPLTASVSTPTAQRKPAKKPAGKQNNRKKSVQTTTEKAAPSAASLLDDSRQTTDEWYKSARTKKGYGNYVKSGKKWLVEWTAEEHLDDEISADAFDKISAETPLALRALTAYKCEHLERGFASAEGIRSAFKDYFERVCGCQGDFWRYNSHTKDWEGNPVFENGFKTYYESLKNRHNRTATATQALPMLPADLKMIMEYLDSQEAVKYFTLTQRLYFKAFVTTAFTLWTRNDELVNLQFKDIKMNLRSKTGIPYHEFSLIFRKTNKDPTKVQHYMVQLDVAHPEIDCYTHVQAWRAHMESILRRPLAGSDFVFPAIASTGQIKFGESTSRSAFETLLDDVVEKSGVMKGRNGKFTTHCFRRGGAQYRFLWADRKWSLKAVKWWGGWSSNENASPGSIDCYSLQLNHPQVGTLMRYLLDELMAYEEGFSDIMMDDRVSDRHETFMGDDDTAPVSRADLLKLEDNIFAKIQGLIVASPTRSNTSIIATSTQLPLPQVSLQSDASDGPPLPVRRRTSPPAPIIPQSPRPSRIPETNSLDDALEYWENGAPSKGLDIPLKNWSTHFKSSEYATEAVKLGNIRFVCEEFLIHCGGNYETFEERFPGLRMKFTMLMKAVRGARKLRGDTKSRKSRK
ncbi:hypothetical protein C8R43DRAFT_1134814 [Mycena crocata]|nr:hypothetical protein C8R43DRAFT_1134814 [Mycena crocata]